MKQNNVRKAKDKSGFVNRKRRTSGKMAAITNRTDATIDLEEQEKVIKKEICIEVENGSIANRPMNENYEDGFVPEETLNFQNNYHSSV